MTDDEKMFVYTRRGLSRQIVPRNRRGWIAFGFWMLALAPIVALYTWLMADATDTARIAYSVVYFAAMGVWVLAMFHWMKARSEIVDLDELLELKRKRDREKRR